MVDLTKALQPWQQQPGETEKAYAAFRAYLSMPVPRNYNKLSNTLSKQLSQIKAWGTKYSWVTRAAAYDAWQADALDDKTRSEVGKVQKIVITEEIKHYNTLIDLWEKELAEVSAILLDPGLDRDTRRKAILDMQRLVKLRDDLSKMARRAAHLPQTYRALPQAEVDDIDKEYYLDWEKGPQEIEDG